jgi:hypothetical protein
MYRKFATDKFILIGLEHFTHPVVVGISAGSVMGQKSTCRLSCTTTKIGLGVMKFICSEDFKPYLKYFEQYEYFLYSMHTVVSTINTYTMNAVLTIHALFTAS